VSKSMSNGGPRGIGLERIMEIVKNTFGETSRTVFEALIRINGEAQDEEIASISGLHVNEVRRILYKLAEHGFVTSRRIRDRETGYYIYFWRANSEYLPQVLISRKKLVMNKLVTRLRYEETYIFTCPGCRGGDERFSFDDALSNDFKCPNCGAPLVPIDNTAIVKRLKEIIEFIKASVERDEKRLYSRSR
jgi:transcription initiation factor TFIIE subunit alpha